MTTGKKCQLVVFGSIQKVAWCVSRVSWRHGMNSIFSASVPGSKAKMFMHAISIVLRNPEWKYRGTSIITVLPTPGAKVGVDGISI